jgi:hypothetical protein
LSLRRRQAGDGRLSRGRCRKRRHGRRFTRADLYLVCVRREGGNANAVSTGLVRPVGGYPPPY